MLIVRRGLGAAVVGVAIAAGAASAPRASIRCPAPHRGAPRLATLGFETNRGQFADGVRFARRTRGGALVLTKDAIAAVARCGGTRSVSRARFVGANPDAAIGGEDEARCRVAYFRGADRSRDVAGVPTFGRVRYDDLWDGVDLVVHADRDEYDFEVAPGADPSVVRLAFDGDARVDADGALSVATDAGVVRHLRPRVFQPTADGPRELAAAWDLRDDGTAGFALAAHDPSLPLVLDPVIEFASYVGGSGTDDEARIVVAPDGGVLLTSTTNSADLPELGGSQSQPAGANDVLVMRLAADGSGVEWATYLGGADFDEAREIATDASGDAYVCGSTGSADFPTTAGVHDRTLAGAGDGFVARISADGSALKWSTFLGGALDEDANDLEVVANGVVWVCGRTTSDDFPVVGGVGVNGGASTDAFLARLDANGSALGVSSYLTGNGFEFANAVEIDGAGSIYVAGVTNSETFAILSGGVDSTFNGELDVFLVKLNANASAVVWGTFLGGSGDDGPDFTEVDLALGTGGAPIVVGATQSAAFPSTSASFQFPRGSGQDMFVTKIAADGKSIAWSSVWGGSGDDELSWAGVDELRGVLHVAGSSRSKDFAVAGAATSGKLGGQRDIVAGTIDEATGALASMTFLGGKGFETNAAGALAADGGVFVVGDNFAGKAPLVQPFDTRAKGVELLFTRLGFPSPGGATGTAAAAKKAKAKTTAVGATGVVLVTVKNTSATGNLRIDVAQTAAPFTVLGALGANVVPPGGTLYVPVGFRPTVKGKAAGTLNLTTSDAAHAAIAVPLSGKGK